MKESIIHTFKEKKGWQSHRQATQAPSQGLKQLQQLPIFTMLSLLSLQVLQFCNDSFWINHALQMAPQVASGRSEKRWSGDRRGHKTSILSHPPVTVLKTPILLYVTSPIGRSSNTFIQTSQFYCLQNAWDHMFIGHVWLQFTNKTKSLDLI